jgi:AMP deaminase
MADITKELFHKLEKSVYQCAEWRISIYGKAQNEWIDLAKWVISHKLFSPNQRWLIQIPRIFFVYKSTGDCKSFEDLIASK